MWPRSKILSQSEVPSNKRVRKALEAGDLAKYAFYGNDTLERFDEIEREREQIKRLIRRLNRRHRRLSGLSLKNS